MSERALKTRAKIMDATRAFIVREGVGRLSIDKIVKESGTSKGAFLYHFKNRKALFCALVEEYVDHLNERMNFHMSKYQDAEEPLILGYASWYEDFDKDDGGFAVLGVALLALLLHEPDALKPFHDWYAKVFKMVQDSPIKTPQLLTAIMAFEGFFFTHKIKRRKKRPGSTSSSRLHRSLKGKRLRVLKKKFPLNRSISVIGQNQSLGFIRR